MSMNETIPRKYVSTLAIVSAVILATGAALKPESSSGAPPPPSPSETASLQRKLRGEEVQRVAEVLSERARVVAESVALVTGRGPGVRWGSDILVAGSDRPLLTVSSDGVPPRPVMAVSKSEGGEWVVVVTKNAEGAPEWIAAIDGGRHRSTCRGVPYDERLLNAPVSAVFKGAGVFTLDGSLLGVVARCDDSFHVVDAASVPALLKAAGGSGPFERLEMRVSALGETEQNVFAHDSGVLVTEISRTGAAYQSGLRAGDLITGVADKPVVTEEDISAEELSELTVYRAGRRAPIRIRMTPSSADAAIGLRGFSAAAGTMRARVDEDSPAYRAGVRTGDSIVQVGATRNPTPTQLSRALASGTTTLIVYEREGTEYAGWVKR